MKRLQVEWTLRAQAGQRERFTPSRQVREGLEVFSIGRSGPDTHKGKRHHQEPETDPWFHSQFLSRSSQSGSFFPRKLDPQPALEARLHSSLLSPPHVPLPPHSLLQKRLSRYIYLLKFMRRSSLTRGPFGRPEPKGKRERRPY